LNLTFSGSTYNQLKHFLTIFWYNVKMEMFFSNIKQFKRNSHTIFSQKIVYNRIKRPSHNHKIKNNTIIANTSIIFLNNHYLRYLRRIGQYSFSFAIAYQIISQPKLSHFYNNTTTTTTTSTTVTYLTSTLKNKR
jgi:hypothetical protein